MNISKKNTYFLNLLFFTVLSNLALAENTLPVSLSPNNATAYIITPQNNAIVSEIFTVQFGLRGMEVSPAGIQKDNAGHHHLLIDSDQLPDLNQPLGNNVKHFGGGQTETTLTLSSGKHTLQLILADHQHMPHQPPVISEKITITVQTKK